MARLLSGFTVVEIGSPLTEYGGNILAGLGATVWLVEPPGGAATRRRGPFAPGASESRKSIPFLARNLNKRSVVLDPANEGDASTLRTLIATADVVLDADTSPFHQLVLASSPPRLVFVSDEQRLGSSSVVSFAASGGLSSSGWPHQPPCNAPSWLALDVASAYAAAMALVAALAAPAEGGASVHYEIPLADAALAAITPWTRPLHSYGMQVSGQGAQRARLGAGPYPIYRTSDDRFVRVLTATPKQWRAFIELLGSPDSLTGPEWDAPGFRAANFEVVTALAADIMAGRTQADLFARGQALGLTITPVFTIADFMADAHVNGRGVFASVDDPDLGPVKLIRQPVLLEDGPLPAVPAPALGSHSAEARSLPPAASAPADTWKPVPGLPLAGMRVLEFGVGAVVPEGASLLALLGAEVIKIESRTHIDFLRQVGLNGPGDFNNCPSFNQMNLGVRSLAVDMKSEGGREVVRRLAEHCDVVMENMRGGVLKSWGFDYESVKTMRPDVIYVTSQGLGDGVYGGYQTYGPNLQTFSAVTGVWAHPDDPYPVGSTLNHPDHIAGKQAAVALLAAVIERKRTGQGRYLDCAQFETAAALIADKFLQEQLCGTVAPLGNRSHDFAPHGCYPCAGEDQWCAIAVENEEQWQAFARIVGEPWTARPEFATMAGRLAANDELDRLVSDWTAAHDRVEVETVMRAAGVPASRMIDGDDLAAQADRHNGGLFASVPHPTAGARWQTGLPIIDLAQGRFPTKRSPILGEDDEYILFDLLGLPPAYASELVASGAIGN